MQPRSNDVPETISIASGVNYPSPSSAYHHVESSGPYYYGLPTDADIDANTKSVLAGRAAFSVLLAATNAYVKAVTGTDPLELAREYAEDGSQFESQYKGDR